jgi:hypothetical protein
MARATDTHLIMRKHSVDGCAVLEAVTRSFAQPRSRVIHYSYPSWILAPEMDPNNLHQETTGRKAKTPKKEETSPEEKQSIEPKDFVYRFCATIPQEWAQIESDAKAGGLSLREAKALRDRAIANGFLFEVPHPRHSQKVLYTTSPSNNGQKPLAHTH